MEQKRFKDEYGYKYDFAAVIWRGEQVAVHCPRCQGQAFISKSKEDCYYAVRCSHCYYTFQQPESYKFYARGVCSHCERYFNIEIHDDRTVTHKNTNIHCPHCETRNQVPVHRMQSREWHTDVIKNGKDPIFQLQLYFLDYYRGKPVWALNRIHLNYLLSYISAELREKPTSGMMRTASHSIPKYIKDAKNRQAILKILQKLQHKQASKGEHSKHEYTNF
ncbi:hypothetical protein V2U94_07450 [Paenibacillus polymyxa]|uniref:hypothetical protein n=1 Tax=Paenibacillus polymyxa TaxID=1406 RepID=UPI002ED162FC|nr:hypothetical protein [Paenibacillus polymyxa]